MTIDEIIKHYEEVAEEQEKLYRLCPATESGIFHCDGTKDCITLKNGKNKGCQKCADEHHQLAEWLKELKKLRVCYSQLRRYCNETIDIIEKLRDELKVYKEQGGDAISRQAVLEGIRNLYPDIPIVDIMGARRKWLEKYAPYFECENVVEQLPSVTPQQRTGQWIDVGSMSCRCNKCGCKNNKETRFCPDCGAKMEVEE